MLARAVRTGLRAPAIRTPSANFRIAPAPQWTRSFADHKRPNNKGSSRAQSDNAKFSKSQEEFNTKASPSENVTPKNEAGEAAEPFQGGPLPDLTQGIPSTIEYELYGKKAAQGGPATGLNLTQDPNQEPGPGTGGRPRGELPESAYISSGEKKRLRVANYMYGAFFASCIVGFGYLGRNWETEEEERQHQETAPSGWSPALMWKRARARTGDQLNYYNEPAFKKLLPDPDPSFERPYTLILSLEDLLIHSEWSRDHGWRMAKRPGVDYFLRYLSQYYELVIFTTVPWAVGEPVIRKLDPYHIVTWPLYREATMYRNGEYVKDLSYLNRDLSKVIMLDTSKAHAEAQPENAIILPKWTGNPKDKELVALIPFLEYIPTMAIPDVRKAIASFEGHHIPTEFAAREAVARKKFQEQLDAEKKKHPKGNVSWLNNALGIKPMNAFEGEQSASEAFAQGKMLQDQARERGQKNYEALEKMIREEGEKWLKEEAAHEEMAKQEGMKAMKSGLTGFFGVPKEGESSTQPESK